MSGLLRLVVLYASRTPVQTCIVAVCVGITLALPITGRVLTARYEARLAARASAVPLVVGAKGSRFDLAMSTLFFRGSPAEPVPLGLVGEIQAQGRGTAVPIRIGAAAAGRPVVAVGIEYFGLRGLSVDRGTLPVRLADAVVGSSLARRTGLTLGGTLMTERKELFDLSVPTPISLRVVGILAPTGEAEDEAVLVDIETAWVIAGYSHAHTDAGRLDETDIQLENDDLIVVRPTLEAETRVTDENLAGFHLHADAETLPITAVLVFPDSDKDLAILEAGINARSGYQAIEPAELVAELFDAIFRVRPVFDAIAAVLGISTVSLVVLTSVLASRLRADEFAAIEHVGAPRWFVFGLVAGQTCIILLIGAIAAGGVVTSAVMLADRVFGL